MPATRTKNPGLAVFVGGIPGAGKTTALRAVAPDLVGTVVLDPEFVRDRLQAWLPARTPYGLLRPLVHAVQFLTVLALLAIGPEVLTAVSGRRRLLIHDPSTRQRRARLLARLADARGWSTVAVFVDVPVDTARRGQHDRGRVVRAASFGRHVRRWGELRDELTRIPYGVTGAERVLVVGRDAAAATLRRVVNQTAPVRSSRMRAIAQLRVGAAEPGGSVTEPGGSVPGVSAVRKLHPACA